MKETAKGKEKRTARRLAAAGAALLLLAGLPGCGFFHRERPLFTEEEKPVTDLPQEAGWDIRLEREGETAGGLRLWVRYGEGQEEQFTIRFQPGERVRIQLKEGRSLLLAADASGEISIALREGSR